MSTRTSEILLIAILVVIVGFTRIYFGGPDGFMVVWKGEFGYKDTIVNLEQFSQIPVAQAQSEHPNVVFQLEEMGFFDPFSGKPQRKPVSRPESPKTDLPSNNPAEPGTPKQGAPKLETHRQESPKQELAKPEPVKPTDH